MEAPSSRLKKGAWTAEEDSLLRQYIDEYGEGKWHQVSLRTGLNRCRKSCRLRWLNYLKPDIKRGKFSCDEVDLLLCLHRLLGNRWALIAGRIPGRTANDIKNYWNTHLSKKKHISCKNKMVERKPTCSEAITPSKIDVIKPQPQSLSSCKTCSHVNGLPEVYLSETINTNDNITCNTNNEENNGKEMDGESVWWESLVEESREADAMGPEPMTIEEVGTSLMNSSPSMLDYEQLWSAVNAKTGKLD